MDPRFDDLLHTVIVQKGQGIYGFFDAIMGFLYRRTDLFYEMAPNENMGFFPGQAEAIVCSYFRKYQSIHFKEKVPKRNIDPKEIEEFLKKQKEQKSQKEVPQNTNTVPQLAQEKVKLSPKEESVNEHASENVKPNSLPVESKPVVLPKPEVPVQSISTYNGDVCENYSWSQGVYDVNIQIKLPEKSNKKDLTVKLTSAGISIKYNKSNEAYFESEFCEKIKSDESYWTLEDNQAIILFLDKAQEKIWNCAFKGHREIDTKTVDNSKKIEEFDYDTQAALQKIVYEQNRKKNGLPTTEEEKKLESLKEAWNKPDSPFRGQPFDPSMFNMNEPIYYNTPDYEAKLRNKEQQK